MATWPKRFNFSSPYWADASSFDDSSSISSGEISDTIAEISTDENLTGSSLSANSETATNNPYGSLKRAPQSALTANLTSRSLPNKHSLIAGGPKPGGLLLGRDSVDAWKKYRIGEDNALSDTKGNASLDPGPWVKGQHGDMKVFNTYRGDLPAGALVKKKTSQGTGTEVRGVAVEDPSLKNIVDSRDSQQSSQAPGQKLKRDSETNTDLSVLMMRRAQASRPAGTPAFALRRPLVGPGASPGKTPGARQVPIPKLDADKTGKSVRSSQNKTASGTQTNSYIKDPNTDMGPESYSASTLERKKRGILSPKSQTSSEAGSPTSDDYRSSTLGRRKPETNIKERLFGSRGSLNKVTTQENNGLCPSTIISNPHATYGKDRMSDRSSNSHGSVSDTSPPGQSPYVNINIGSYLTSEYLAARSSTFSTPTSPSGSPWIKSPSSVGPRSTLSETESMESLSSTASSIQAQIQQARAHGLMCRSILQQERNENNGVIERSDSFRSTQSEKVYGPGQGSELMRTGSYGQLSNSSQPTSPTPSQGSQSSSRFNYPLSALGSNVARSPTQAPSPYVTTYLPLAKLVSKDDDVHGSSLSLVSSSSSVMSSAEEKHAHEVRKLRRELECAQEKVSTLTSQLSTNAHVVAAFEQSLSNMTHRLQNLTSSAEHKDDQLNELRATIEELKKQSGIHFSPSPHRRKSSNASTLSRGEPGTPDYLDGHGDLERMSRHMSSDSMSSINSLSSACSATSQHSSATDTESAKKKKKNWLRSSFSKAFSRKKNKHGSVSDVEPDTVTGMSEMGLSLPSSPMLYGMHSTSTPNSSLKGSHSSHQLCDPEEPEQAVAQLQNELHEKDMKLTDIRLEALSSAAQLEQLRDTMNRMKNEMASLKADNERLQRLVEVKSPTEQPSSPHGTTTLEKRLSLGDNAALDMLLNESPTGHSGLRITISVNMTTHTDLSKGIETKLSEVVISAMSVSGKTKWDMLDSIVKKVFKEYVLRIDPVTNLGLSADCVLCYNIGEITRDIGGRVPELLPCGYLVGDNTNIGITLKGTQQNTVDALAFEALIPKSIMHRYVSLLLEHHRIILCGPSGTGKTYLAQRLAEYIVIRLGKEVTAGAIATFNVDHKSSKELRQYLGNIAEQCESTSVGELPSVIILDNLHHVSSLGEVFNGFLSVKYHKCPYIIGTMNQATCSTTNLQLHHNFRWVLCANHMEPVKGFLGRYLRRKMVETEVQTGVKNNDLLKIVDWMPKIWQHLNKFLETHSSSDVTIGPRLFLSCPMDVSGSQVWFTDLWNYSIVPYLLEAVREGLQLYGRRAPWEDPADYVMESYPWPNTNAQEIPSLLKLRPEDVGYDTQGSAASGTPKAAQAAQSDAEGDPLLNMLMRLQEAASYSSPQSNDSDSTSLDSHSSGVHEYNNSGSSSVESTL